MQSPLHSMKKILIVLLFFFSNQGFTASNTKVKVAIKPDNGDWLEDSIYPITLKEQMRMRYKGSVKFIMGDFDNDGVDDLFVLGTPNIKNLFHYTIDGR